MIAFKSQNATKLMCRIIGGAGGQTDPTQTQIADLSKNQVKIAILSLKVRVRLNASQYVITETKYKTQSYVSISA